MSPGLPRWNRWQGQSSLQDPHAQSQVLVLRAANSDRSPKNITSRYSFDFFLYKTFGIVLLLILIMSEYVINVPVASVPWDAEEQSSLVFHQGRTGSRSPGLVGLEFSSGEETS